MSIEQPTSKPALKPARVNLAILTYNALDYTKMCLESITRNTRVDHNIFVLDNGSTDGTRDWLRQQRQPNLHYEDAPSNLGVPGGRNHLIKIIQQFLPDDGYIVFADNDMELKAGWDDVYLDFFRDHPHAGIASAFGHRMIVRKHYRELLPAPLYTAPVDVACGGFACWVSAAAIKAVGGFDEKLGLFWHEDDDFSVRTLAAGFDVYALPHVPVVHHEHKSGAANPGIKSGGSPKNQQYLCEKWRSLGVVDAAGRIVRKVSAPTAKNPDMGGYRWVEPCVDLIRLGASGEAKMLTLELSCAKREFYNKFPFSVEVLVDNQPSSSLTFALDDERHELSLMVKPNSVVRLTSDAYFNPVMRGLGADWRDRLCLRVREQSSDAPNDWKSNWQVSAQWQTAKPDVTWISPVSEDDSYWNFTAAAVAALLKSGKSVGVEPTGVNENFLTQMQSDPAWYAQWNEAVNAPGKAETLIVAQDPLGSNGVSCFEKIRRQHPEARRVIAAVIPPRIANIEGWCKAADQADELWVLSEEERNRVVDAGLASDKVKTMPWPLNTDVYAIRREPAAALIEGRFCFLTHVSSPDDPFLRVSVTAFLKAFSKTDPVCLFISIPPVGGMLSPEILRSLVLENIDTEACAPVFTMDMAIPPSKRGAVFSGTHCMMIRADSGDRATVMEAAATGLPIFMVNPADQSCSCVTESMDMLQDRMKKSTLFAHGSQHDAAIASPATLESCVQSMRKAFAEKATLLTQAQGCAADIHRDYANGSCAAWMCEQLAQKPGARSNSISRGVEKTSTPETFIIELGEGVTTIGVDARTLTCPENIERGIGHYTVNHLKEIIGATPNWRYILYRNEADDSPLLQQLRSYPNTEVAEISNRQRDSLDLYHIADPMTILPGFDSPLLLAPNVPTSMVFYDLIPMVKREMHLDRWEDWRRRAYMQRLAQLQRSQAEVLAISECTRQDLHRATNYPLDKITPIMAGINRAASSKRPTQDQIQAVLQKFGLTAPFFMSVGGLDGHKGFLSTAQAYAEVSRQRNVQFAVVGSFSDPYKEQYRKVFEQNQVRGVVFTGYLSREEMACLFAASMALVFPSHYEGFGFPVVEAMAHGCPVITTNVSSLPEVAGDAALLVAPEDSAGIANSMRRLVDEPGLRPGMIERGLAQAQKFSWALTARKTLDVWSRMLENRKESSVSAMTTKSDAAIRLS